MISIALILSACTTTTSTTNPSCTLTLSTTTTEVYAGDTIEISGSPLTAPYDTQAQIRGTTATVLEVNRTECAVCDACQEAAECNGCTQCGDCISSCESCDESLLIEIPQPLEPGPAELIVVNAYGSSDALLLTILPSTDAPLDTASTLSGSDSGLDFHTGDTGLTSSAFFWCGDAQTEDRPTRCDRNRLRNSSTIEDGDTVTFWTRVATVVDHCLSLMY